MSRARSNRRRRPFDGDLCNCGLPISARTGSGRLVRAEVGMTVPLGSHRTLGRFNFGDGQPAGVAKPLDCWHPDEHPAGGHLGHRKEVAW